MASALLSHKFIEKFKGTASSMLPQIEKARRVRAEMDAQAANYQRVLIYIGRIPHGFYKDQMRDALTSLRTASPGVCPNYGFMEQLAILENMGNKVDRGSPFYKKFKVGALGKVHVYCSLCPLFLGCQGLNTSCFPSCDRCSFVSGSCERIFI